jgi:hypothetical protein
MSTLRADTIQNTSGGAVTLTNQSAAKAWCYISSSGTVVSNSVNIASVTDNGTGSYQPNFSSNMSNATYNHAISTGSHATSHNCSTDTSNAATSSFRIRCANGAESATQDHANTYGLIHGDLA